MAVPPRTQGLAGPAREFRPGGGEQRRGWAVASGHQLELPDGLADEGPSAGPASLVGREIARDRGWTAPDAGQSGATGATAETKTEAVEQADTSRAETETVQETSDD
mgnify:CR=1 FL=1